ncbi:AAA family ATPase [Niveibacterium sp. SC-1]|uniref:AAA family ATPase n=1 Tax=Niveibacterium sp. SC-1 TaxID=3135646 RepID=UPI00311DC8D9
MASAALSIPGYALQTRIHQSRLRSIWRAVRLADGLPVVLKTLDAEYPPREAAAALRREHQITHRLQEVEQVIRVLGLESWGNGNLALALEPFGRSLADEIAAQPGRRLPLPRFFRIALALAEALGRVHELEVVHKNIEPHSILVDAGDAIRLTDFQIASELSRERADFSSGRRLAGALPYLSPEQTGRMNRDVDYRSDFYSLGITFFELLTGSLPFQADSVLEWVHCHIGRRPPLASEAARDVPEPLAAIVAKLMAKNADERYQSSFGLLSDLRRCERELSDTGRIAPFPLGARDVSRRFQIPQQLYGREPELATLLALFDEVAEGGNALCMVSGYSGVGKSALVNELAKPLVGQRGYLVQGKFDQFQRSTPYSALASAFRSLVQQLRADEAERPGCWRDQLVAAVAPNMQVLIEFAPELEQLAGPQPRVPELPRTEAQNRFQLALLAFLRVVTSEAPLAIFLDDLQFGDAATLNLIRRLATARDLRRFLLIGAYRSNEVETGHALRLALNEIAQARPVQELTLRPLDADAVAQLVADTLHVSRDESEDLAALLHEKAQGNPFFLNEILRTLASNKAISFAPELGRWRWDMEAVRRSGLTDNVVEFVVGNLRRLPHQTQHALRLAACIGASFDLRTLALILESSMDVSADALLPALRQQMVLPLHEDYTLAGAAGAGEHVNPVYRFQHDRVQQAAYELIDGERRQAVHLSVGRLMQRDADPAVREARLIDIVDHLNQGRRLITDAAERLALARLNLAAGQRAQRASAYESALNYLCIGEELLPPQAWSGEYELAMALATERQQCAYLTARYEEAETGIETLLARARSDLERAEILSMRTRQYSTTGKMEASIHAAIMGLSLLGIAISEQPDDEAIRRERAAVRRNLAGRRIAELVDAPDISDARQKIAIRLLMEIFPAAFLSGSGQLFPFLVLKAVNISLRYGKSPETAFTYAAYGMLLCGVLEDPATGFAFGQLAVAMNDRLDDITLKSRVIYVYAMFVHHWSRHWSSMTPWFRRGIESGYQSGDLLYLAYSAQDCVIWDPGLDLDTAEQEHAAHLAIVRDCAYRDSLDSGTLFLQMQRCLLGRTVDAFSLNDADFDEAACVMGMLQRRFMTGVANYHIYKTELCYFHGDPEQALQHVRVQDGLLASSMSLPQLVRYYIAAFLTLAACLPDMEAGEQVVTRARMREDQRRMRRWARHCPENFLHLQLLMEAEVARLDGRVDAALHRYEAAMDAARANEFLRDEALANELAARHLFAAGRRKAGIGYLRAARHLYERWGARRKLELLEDEFPQLLRTPGKRALRTDLRASAATPVDGDTLDMASVMKASRAISGELVLEQLWTTTMRIMLENAGGQRGGFVIRDEGRLMVEGLCEIGNAAQPSTVPAARLDEAGMAAQLPLALVQQVLQTNEPIVLNELPRSGALARDAYLLAHRPQSLLCLPLQRQGKTEGVLFMENWLTAGVFSEERIEVIRLLAAQVSISIENARLVEAQRRLIDAQQRFVPSQFLDSLAHRDIARVELGEHVAKPHMSVMFADLRGFTPLAEQLDPRAVIALLNRYFLAMEPAITGAGGFIDSFAGDEIKALFDDSADGAVRGAVGMWQALDQFNAASREMGQPQLNMGIGINTGPVVLGTVGGQARIQCSVIGDTVNLASRIEQLTKLYKARCLISGETLRALNAPDPLALRRVDRVAVKGKTLAVELYQVLTAETPELRSVRLATREALHAAQAAYFARDFAGARSGFKAISEVDPADPVPQLFLERCERYLRNPPPPDWTGFETLEHK